MLGASVVLMWKVENKNTALALDFEMGFVCFIVLWSFPVESQPFVDVGGGGGGGGGGRKEGCVCLIRLNEWN